MATAELLIEAATRNGVMLERLKAGEVQKIDPFLRRIDKDIRERLSRDALTAYSRQRLETMLATIDAMIAKVQGEFSEQLLLDLFDIGSYEAEFEARSLDQVLINISVATPTVQSIQAAVKAQPLSVTGPDGGKLLEPFIADWLQAERNRVTGAIRMGYVQGETNQQIINRIRGTKALQYSDGLLSISKRNAEAVVRTGIQHVASVARMETWKANSDVVTGYRWVSTLDGRTSTQCFLAGTPVSWSGLLEKVFRAQYVGEVITVTTAAGKKLEGTPNHPILTPNGFLPLGELNPGQQIVGSMFGERLGVGRDQEISVPSKIGELFDFLSHQPGADVHRKRATADDFYGDGRGMDGEVDAVFVDGQLSDRLMTAGLENIKNDSLSFDYGLSPLARRNDVSDGFVTGRPISKPSEFTSGIVKRGVKPGFAAAKLLRNFAWASAIVEHLKGFLPVREQPRVGLATLEGGHDSMLLEQSGDGSCGSPVLGGDSSRGVPFAVETDHIVSVSSEFRRCHVYTLQCSQGIYNAGGIIVKNCKSLDGRSFKMGKGPLPPIHIRCRSTTAAELDARYSFLDEDATRASKDGYVDAGESYYSWLQKQPVSFQDIALGKERATLFRKGGLSAERFAELQLDRQFKPLTLDQLRALEPAAFERAGI